MGMHSAMTGFGNDYGVEARRYSGANSERSMGSPSLEESPFADCDTKGAITDWIEMWDYVGGIRFRAFVAENENEDEKVMFVFFDQSVVSGDLKAG